LNHSVQGKVSAKKDFIAEKKSEFPLLMIQFGENALTWEKWNWLKSLCFYYFLEISTGIKKLPNSFSFRKISLYVLKSGHIWSKTATGCAKANFFATLFGLIVSVIGIVVPPKWLSKKSFWGFRGFKIWNPEALKNGYSFDHPLFILLVGWPDGLTSSTFQNQVPRTQVLNLLKFYK